MNIIPKPYSVFLYEGKSISKANEFDFIGEEGHRAYEDFAIFFDRIKTDIVAENNDKLHIELKYETMEADAYKLLIDEKIVLTASTDSGFFYALQTLKQIIYYYWVKKNMDIPSVTIEDKPKYSYRGYMLDVCRHFFSVEEVKNILDILALHKLNKFHLHLTDDQAWRIEIKQYPLLTKIGAFREQTLGDGIAYGGFYSQEDIREIVRYAESKFIEVIPEIDLPGHFTAAIASYPELSCGEKQIEVATSFGIKSDIACAGKEKVYTFFERVIDELNVLFKSDYIHIGGDEAPKSNWEDCMDCKEQIKSKNLASVEELQGHMVNRIAEYIESKGKKAIVWNESLNSEILKESVICQYWSDGKIPHRVLRGINSGRKTIISKFSPYYLDYPFGMHSLKAVYTFEPELKGAKKTDSIWGVECPLWTEYVKDKKKIDYQTFPRLTAMAETAWTDSAHRDYADFEARLKEFYSLYPLYGITPAPLKAVNPNKIQGLVQILKFLRPVLTLESIKAMVKSNKAAKKVKSARK